MKIGFDFVQPSFSQAGCGWYVQTLLTAMAAQAPNHEFLAYRSFANWCLDQENLAPMPTAPNISDPLAGLSKEASRKVWQNDLAAGTAPGRPDIVHSTSFQAPRFGSAKLVVTIFDLSFWAEPAYTTEANRLHCQTGVLDSVAHADGLIFISEHARREFDRFVPHYHRKGRISTVITPLASRWAPQPRQTPIRSGDYWLFVGSLEPRKNLQNLLIGYEAYAASRAAPKPLWLAGGDGWKNAAILAKIEPLESRGLVRRLGYVPEDQLRDLYQNAIALVFPSWYEGFGLPVLEAMGQCCPVICSDRASLKEVGGNAVLYVDPASPKSITLAFEQLEQDVAFRRDLTKRGLERVTKFSWGQTAEQTLAFYEQLLLRA